MSGSKVLVLAGGSVKAAFQVGVLNSLFESGFVPDKIYGISAGSMNAAFLANYLGGQVLNHRKPDFVEAAAALADFWIQNINRPESLARRRGTYELGMSALRRNFEGLLDTTPLRDMLHENIKIEYLLNSPVGLQIGAVDIQQGGIMYASPQTDNFHDYILASSAIPILMPVVKIGGDESRAFLDGGLRDVAPIKKAILDGASEVVCIACHTSNMEAGEFAYGNLLALVDRIMDITVNESLNNDLEWALMHNRQEEKYSKKVKLSIFRPQEYLHIDIQNFDGNDIKRLIHVGKESFHQI